MNQRGRSYGGIGLVSQKTAALGYGRIIIREAPVSGFPFLPFRTFAAPAGIEAEGGCAAHDVHFSTDEPRLRANPSNYN
jgi:hypothetical protein